MSNITFKPWVGKNFGETNYGKLLIIGDSHYFTGPLPTHISEFTRNQIAELDIIASHFHKTILSTFGHKKHSDFWDNIAFANAIQSPFTFARQEPTKKEKDIAKLAFKEYLDITNPEKVIVFSSRLWEYFFKEAGWGKHLGKINDRWNIRELDYQGGTCKAMGVYHPSAVNFGNKDFSNVVKNFLNN